MIVVDANIIGYLFLANERSEQAEAALRKEPRWAAPLLWRSELRNVLAHYLRKQVLDIGEAQQIMNAAGDLMHGREYQVPSLRVLNLVLQSSFSAYDCEFVALAQDLEVPLVTVDREILAQFPGVAVTLDAFIAA